MKNTISLLIQEIFIKHQVWSRPAVVSLWHRNHSAIEYMTSASFLPLLLLSSLFCPSALILALPLHPCLLLPSESSFLKANLTMSLCKPFKDYVLHHEEIMSAKPFLWPVFAGYWNYNYFLVSSLTIMTQRGLCSMYLGVLASTIFWIHSALVLCSFLFIQMINRERGGELGGLNGPGLEVVHIIFAYIQNYHLTAVQRES